MMTITTKISRNSEEDVERSRKNAGEKVFSEKVYSLNGKFNVQRKCNTLLSTNRSFSKGEEGAKLFKTNYQVHLAFVFHRYQIDTSIRIMRQEVTRISSLQRAVTQGSSSGVGPLIYFCILMNW